MKNFIKALFILLFLNTLLLANKNVEESQPEIIFNYDNLEKSHNILGFQALFNKGVLLLSKNQYKEAIAIFQKSKAKMPIASNLNIGVAYYKLNSIDNAVIYLNKIYSNRANITKDSYSYMAACFYLYKISKDDKYLKDIIKISSKFKNLSQYSREMLADSYIFLKRYKSALKVLNNMQNPMNLKKALLYMKLNDFDKAIVYLNRAKNSTVNSKKVDIILWFETYSYLKLNNINKLKEVLGNIAQRKSTFKANLEFPIEIYFNKNKYTPKQYLDFLINFSDDRMHDFIYYFAPFVFSDYQEVLYDTHKGFIYDKTENILDIDKMLKYNGKFLKIVKDDPIKRVIELQKILKTDEKSYMYYNLGLCLAQNYEFNKALKYFQKAYNLNPGNKLFGVMLLITAQRLHLKLPNEKYIVSNIKSNKGLYNYFGKSLYKFFVDKNYLYKIEDNKYKDTIFYKAINFLETMKKDKVDADEPLLQEYDKDPLIYLLKLIQRKKGENDYKYFSRLQDIIPLSINNNFLEGSLIVTNYYMDILKALGLFSKADFNINKTNSPSYLRTKALANLYFGEADETIKIIEYLQKEYKLEDKYTLYLLVAAYLEAGRYSDASIQISLIKALLKDKEADFLTAVQLIQELKMNSAKLLLKKPYFDTRIDFKIKGFDDYLKSL